jgi:hypothetical protein
MMAKRVCYIHVGPHKTGTTSIQWFLQENRAELLKHGYFVPEGETKHGAHHAIVQKLCGQELGDHREAAAAKCIQAIIDTPSEAIVISSEALAAILRNRDHARVFFNRIRELNVEPKLVLFPRNQSQWINSSYCGVVKTFRRCEPFQTFVLGVRRQSGLKFSNWIELAYAHGAELIARPFNGETIAHGVVAEFLGALGVDSLQFRDADIRRNEAAGPFTVGVARGVMRSLSIDGTGKQLKWLQAMRCKNELAAYLGEKGLADAGYCGMTTALARHIEEEMRSDNDVFAQRAWGRRWAEIFAADIGQEFAPNDFEICRPGWATRRRLRRALREMKAIVQEILLDPALAVEAPWNDLQRRAGRTPER